MPKVRKQILVPHGCITKLAQEHQCSRVYVSNCLKGLYDTPKAEKIRTAARKL